MNISNLKEHPTLPNHWTVTVDGVESTIVTKDGQNPLKVLEEALGSQVLTYVEHRLQAYPSIAEQLDMLYHDPNGWRSMIAEIKRKYPKK